VIQSAENGLVGISRLRDRSLTQYPIRFQSVYPFSEIPCDRANIIDPGNTVFGYGKGYAYAVDKYCYTCISG
jgi:hypothetical protein